MRRMRLQGPRHERGVARARRRRRRELRDEAERLVQTGLLEDLLQIVPALVPLP